MGRPLIKICGITNIDDAVFSISTGADFLGFIFYDKSPRFITPEKAGEIILKIKDRGNSQIKFAGVFVNPEIDFLDHVINISHVDIVQLHGDESPEFINNFTDKSKFFSGGCEKRIEIIKALRVKNEDDILKSNIYKTDYILFDTYSDKSYGGTGKIFNWNLLKDYNKKNKLFLSGGINSENVTDAVKSVAPYALDLSSSVEAEPGKKDKKKIEYFFRIIKSDLNN